MSAGQATFDYSGCNVLIFGGTSGINLGIAQGFAEAGANIGVVGRNVEKAEAARQTLRRGSGSAHAYSADVRDMEAVTRAFEAFTRATGPIDVLVSGAAGNFPAEALAMSSNGFRSVVEIDLIGTFHVMRAGYAHLVKPGASVINISAPQAEVAMAKQVHVCAAKAGVDMVTKTLAIEWGPAGVRVNSVIPGPIDGTEGMDRLTPTPESRDAVIQSVPMKRMGEPRDVAGACLFLGSDAARYVSGAILAADGGWLANGAVLDLG